MKTLKILIRRHVYRIVGVSVFIILIATFIFQLVNEQNKAYDDAKSTFLQMKQMLSENQKELTELTKEYSESCLHAAETVSRIIEGDPSSLYLLRKIKEIADEADVDEIHIFDKDGKIITGTEPAYYGFTMDSGEQMSFFKPMLVDKNLKLVQEITENTAENKLMQYSAVWSSDGEFIVQIGRNPVNVIKMTEKNKLSYIFSIFRVDPSVSYYAIDCENGMIVGSNNVEFVGMNCSDVGFNFDDIQNKRKAFYCRVDGHYSLCVFEKLDYDYIGRVISMGNLYGNVPGIILLIAICLIVVAVILVKSFTKYMNRYVVDEIHVVIDKLKSIIDGNLDEKVDIKSSREFSNLSRYINRMVQNRLATNRVEADVNDTLQAAMSAADPDKSLEITLECLGRSLEGERSYIFEKNKQGGDDNTYEWVAEGVTAEKDNLQNLPPEVCMDWYRKFIKKSFLVFENIEEIKEEDPLQYENLKRQNITSIAVVPLYDDNNIIGFFGIDNPPNLRYTVNMLQIMGHFLESMLKTRNLIRDLKQISFLDQLTQIGNRHALWKYLENIEQSISIGIVYCDITGLKRVNDEKGHEAGDKLITSSCKCMKDSLGENSKLFRLGGDELLAVFSGTDETEFLEKVTTLKNSMGKYDVTLAIGAVWENECSKGINGIIGRAENLMYKDKAEYYARTGIERRR